MRNSKSSQPLLLERIFLMLCLACFFVILSTRAIAGSQTIEYPEFAAWARQSGLFATGGRRFGGGEKHDQDAMIESRLQRAFAKLDKDSSKSIGRDEFGEFMRDRPMREIRHMCSTFVESSRAEAKSDWFANTNDDDEYSFWCAARCALLLLIFVFAQSSIQFFSFALRVFSSIKSSGAGTRPTSFPSRSRARAASF